MSLTRETTTAPVRALPSLAGRSRPPGKPNRGPSAGPGNRAALIQAAREVFAERGYGAPLSLVAKRAQVGQGSLYRHFPDRLSLALAVFDENMEGIDAIANDPAKTLRDLLDHITVLTEGTAAILTALMENLDDARAQRISQRTLDAIRAKWDARAGVVGPEATPEDVHFAIGLVASWVANTPRDQRSAAADRAWRLVVHGLGG